MFFIQNSSHYAASQPLFHSPSPNPPLYPCSIPPQTPNHVRPVKQTHFVPMLRRRTHGWTLSTGVVTIQKWSTTLCSPMGSRGRHETVRQPLQLPQVTTGLCRGDRLKIRGDVRRCCCVVSGGVYENLLFFPTIQMIKDHYHGVLVDAVTTAKGKQIYEINKNVRWTDVYDPDDHFPDPADYADMIGVLKRSNAVGASSVSVDLKEGEGGSRGKVFECWGSKGKLAALINNSAGVIATNTAALQLANVHEKLSVALFCSDEKANVFVSEPEEKKCVVITSKTGKLIDIDVEAVKTALQIFSLPLAIA
ncbi:NDH-dependent cyclic electron flow 1 [Perilla frutescens var. frutescens]|nr:NDH-dependent cyclic electron flow 1 [Perilla frutescens var. frutescens]